MRVKEGLGQRPERIRLGAEVEGQSGASKGQVRLGLVAKVGAEAYGQGQG